MNKELGITSLEIAFHGWGILFDSMPKRVSDLLNKKQEELGWKFYWLGTKLEEAEKERIDSINEKIEKYFFEELVIYNPNNMTYYFK